MFESSPTDPCIPCILASVSSTLIFSGDPPELTTISGVPFPASGVPGAGVAAALPLFCGTKVVMMKSYRVTTGSGAARNKNVEILTSTFWSMPSYTGWYSGEACCTRVYLTVSRSSVEGPATEDMNSSGSLPTWLTCMDRDLCIASY